MIASALDDFEVDVGLSKQRQPKSRRSALRKCCCFWEGGGRGGGFRLAITAKALERSFCQFF